MKVVIAVDSFKGCLSSLEAGRAAAEGVREAVPGAEIAVVCAADGGEGTLEALAGSGRAEIRTARVTGPLGVPVEARWGYVRRAEGAPSAVIEMAEAAGLARVPEPNRDPMNTTTAGVGELIAEAFRAGCREFLVGIGGSATNDCGIGMLEALGFRFIRADGAEAGPFGRDLEGIGAIDAAGVLPGLLSCRFRAACDVDNPLCGPRGCSAVFGPQKGASPEAIARMDAWIGSFARLAEKESGSCGASEKPGAGAAGGLGFALSVFLGAELVPGAELLLDAAGLPEALPGTDLVITGEGRLDAQTEGGKTPAGAARLARKIAPRALVVALAGSAAREGGKGAGSGLFDAVFPIVPGPVTLSEAMEPERARRNLAATAREAAGLVFKALNRGQSR